MHFETLRHFPSSRSRMIFDYFFLLFLCCPVLWHTDDDFLMFSFINVHDTRSRFFPLRRFDRDWFLVEKSKINFRAQQFDFSPSSFCSASILQWAYEISMLRVFLRGLRFDVSTTNETKSSRNLIKWKRESWTALESRKSGMLANFDTDFQRKLRKIY